MGFNEDAVDFADHFFGSIDERNLQGLHFFGVTGNAFRHDSRITRAGDYDLSAVDPLRLGYAFVEKPAGEFQNVRRVKIRTMPRRIIAASQVVGGFRAESMAIGSGADTAERATLWPRARQRIVKKQSTEVASLGHFTPSLQHPWLLIMCRFRQSFLIWRWSRRSRPGVLHALGHTMNQLPLGKSRMVSRMSRLAALGRLFSRLSIALNGTPRWPDPGSRYTTEGVALFLILDVSGSMAETDYTWNQQPVTRLQAAQNVLDLFVMGGTGPDGTEFTGRPDDLIGLATCATRPEIACPLTLAHDALVQIVRAEQPRRMPQESQTNIGDAVALALQHVTRATPSRKAILLLTDGEHNVPAPALAPLAAARLAAALSVPIHAIDLGSDTESEHSAPGDSKVDRVAARKALTDMAASTGGKYFQAADAGALSQVCQALDTLEKSPIETPLYRKYYEVAIWFGVAGLVGMWSAWLLSALFCPVFP